jgi:hypothetical protein
MRIALSGSVSRNDASMFQILHSSMLGSSLMFLITRASIVFMCQAPSYYKNSHEMLIIIAKAIRATTITTRLNLRIRRSYACNQSYSIGYSSIVQLP